MISIAPVRKQVLVNANQQRAFDLFTNQMSRWWPATHSILKSPLKQYVVEPRAGGYVKDGFDALSKGVDHVLGEQLERLRKLIDG
jgi:hypothetical protein